MPELPEVETVMRGLKPIIEGQVIDRAFCGDKGLRIPFPEGLSERLTGQKIQKLSRRAKYIFCHLENGNTLILHLGMSGRVRILAPRSNSPAEKHDHFELRMKDGHHIILNDARRFGMVFDVLQKDISTHPSFAHLGPEPLLEEFNAEYLRLKLKNKTSAIKTAIMDQRIVVGVGNIYACEALYRSRISPKMKASDLSFPTLSRFVEEIKTVLREAIEAGGSTLRDHRLPDGDFGYFQHTHFVYGRENKACLASDCSENITRIIQTGRSTFYCACCQKA